MRGVGIDIVDVNRLKERCARPEFLELVFTEGEREYCEKKGNKYESYAARFAAKEAYMKAVGEGWTTNAQFKEIEVINGESGQPKMVLSGLTKAYFEKQDFKVLNLSLSHTDTTAVAVVIIV